MLRLWIITIAVGCACWGMTSQQAVAQVTPETRKEIAELTKEITSAGPLIRKKDLDEAEKVLSAAAEKLKEISASGKVGPNDPAIKRVTTLLEKQQALLEKAGGKAKPAGPAAGGFMTDVAPLIVQRCVRCHGPDNPRNNLRLDTFAGWRAGGKSGPLLMPGNPSRSLIVARVHAEEGKGRMPPNGDALTDEEQAKISKWIDSGAKFNGGNETATLASLIEAEEARNVVIPKPKGTEQVSFTRDIAPWFSNLCLNCHNSRRKSGGLSVETFFDIMKGGESGEVIVPGDKENSRLFLLVGGKELPRMPQGQARITRKNYEDMIKWFDEGNTYDGGDPRKPISSFVPTEGEMAQRNFAELSDEELQKLRQERTADQYRKAVSDQAHPTLTTPDFLLVGNVEEKRLNQIQELAEEQLKALQKVFGESSKPWRGRLAIFVLKDQFSYSEFNEVIERRKPDPEQTGHSKVTPGQEDAYIVLQDPGENAAGTAALKLSVIEQLTAAYLQKSGKPVPNWVVRGTGAALADTIVPDRKRSENLERTAAPLVAGLTRPEELFAESTFSPTGQRAVGYTLVKFLLSSGGMPRYAQFISAMEGGTAAETAMQNIYGSPAGAIATGYLSKMKSR